MTDNKSVLDPVEDEDITYDDEGNCIISLDFSEEDRVNMFLTYMMHNDFHKCSFKQFSASLESGIEVNKAITETILTEIMNTIVFEKIKENYEELVEEKENDDSNS